MQATVLEYLEAGPFRKCAGKVAIRDDKSACTFSELERFAKNLAALIMAKTSVIRRPIAVFLPKSLPAVVANLGIAYSGNCYACVDIKSPPQRLKGMLDNLEASVYISSATHSGALLALGVREDQIILVEAAMVSEVIYRPEALRERVDKLIDTDPIYIIYTSGSTGIPKGVTIPHRGVIDYIDWARECYQISEKEIIGNQAPFTFDNSTLDLYLCFSCGATLVLIPEDLFRYPVKLIEHLRQNRVNTLFWVPSILTTVANFKILDETELPPLEKILFAGEVMPTRTLNYWKQKYPKALFSNLYGPTEITVDCTYYIANRDLADEEALPIGLPCRNTDILILNEDNQEAKTGEQGELCVRGSSLALGYWNNPEKTAAAFVQNPCNPYYPERIYRTGDLVYRNASGEIMFVGRKDFQIKHLGYRIELGEIEHAAFQVDGIRNCCVVYHRPKSEITLFYESELESSPGLLRERLSAFLPKYMLPTVFRRMPALPRNASGKIDRQALLSSLG